MQAFEEKNSLMTGVLANSICAFMEDIFIFLDHKGKIRYVNRAFYTVLGYAESDIAGRDLLELFFKPEDELITEKTFDAEWTEEDNLRNYNIGIKSKDGDILPFNISIFPVFSDAKVVIGTALVGRDMRQMTDILSKLKNMNETLEEKVRNRTQKLEESNRLLKEAEEKLILSEKMSAMSMLAGGISHEISNPIMAIVGYCDILIDSEADEERKEKLTLIKEFGFKCMNIVSKFCDFAMSPEEVFDDVRVNNVLEDTLLLAENKLKYDVELIKELAPDLPIIKGEANELTSVFINIILNAKDAMPEGGKLLVKTYYDDINVYALIQDFGKGIPSSVLENIFDPFFTTKKTKGTGLGLSVCLETLKAHGGDIKISSEEGKGTTVIVSLPLP